MTKHKLVLLIQSKYSSIYIFLPKFWLQLLQVFILRFIFFNNRRSLSIKHNSAILRSLGLFPFHANNAQMHAQGIDLSGSSILLKAYSTTPCTQAKESSAASHSVSPATSSQGPVWIIWSVIAAHKWATPHEWKCSKASAAMITLCSQVIAPFPPPRSSPCFPPPVEWEDKSNAGEA